jgi:hypothetical protein
LEIGGNAGFIPLYKDIRKIVLKDMYKDLEKGEAKVKSTQGVITTNKETEGSTSEGGIYSPNDETPEIFKNSKDEKISSGEEKIVLPLKKSKSWMKK